jgi:hypothetical protein
MRASTMSLYGLPGEMRMAVRSAPIWSATARATSTGNRTRAAVEVAVAVGAQVGVVGQELVQQEAVAGVQFDAVEPRVHREAGRGGEIGDGAGDLAGRQLPWHREAGRAVRRVRLTGRGDRGRGDAAVRARVQRRVADPPGMHELYDDPAARGVHGLGDRQPGGGLGRRVHAGGVREALTDAAWLHALGDDQAGAGALGVINGGQHGRAAVRGGAVARHRRHHEPVGQREHAEGDRVEQLCHRFPNRELA